MRLAFVLIACLAVSPAFAEGLGTVFALGGGSQASLDSTGKVLSGVGALPNTTVTIYSNGSAVGTTTSNAAGVWSYTFGSAPTTTQTLTYTSFLPAGIGAAVPSAVNLDFSAPSNSSYIAAFPSTF